MTKHKPIKQHSSLELLRKLYRPSYLGRTKDGQRILVRHRNWCQHWVGSPCDCGAQVAVEANDND